MEWPLATVYCTAIAAIAIVFIALLMTWQEQQQSKRYEERVKRHEVAKGRALTYEEEYDECSADSR